MLDWIRDNLPIIFLIIIILLIAFLIVGAVKNESNRIDCGIITNKHMDSGGTYYNSDKNGGHLHSEPPSYYFTITGEKDGAEVSYTFEVSEEDYKAYKIGDFYER